VAAAFISTLEAWNRDGRITKKNVKALGDLVKDVGAKAVAASKEKMAKSEADLAAAKDDAAIEKAKKDIAKDKKAIESHSVYDVKRNKNDNINYRHRARIEEDDSTTYNGIK
jgi:hypothetical protein